MWALWIAVGIVGWFALAAAVALVIGRSIRIADRRELGAGLAAALTTADVPGLDGSAAPTVRPALVARSKRRRVPLPPVGVALAALAVTLEAVGYALRATGAHGRAAQVLSMDAPLSLPRMYITALFAASAVAALSAAARGPVRRIWWAAVGAVAAAICFIKAGGTLHAVAFGWLSRRVSPTGALLVSVLLAVVAIGLLWYLARGERRDRVRVLGSLALYAFAAVGLSQISAAVSESWSAVATFVEESGEALGAVSVLVAVLIGVAPRLVLPADWALRRSADAHTLDATEPVSAARRAAPGR